MAAGQFLQPIISNGGCRPEPFLKVARFDQVPFVLRMVAPDAGITIGLEFHSD